MYVCQELNTWLLMVFLFATEALETNNCIKQWNEKHKSPLFGALLLLIADCDRRVVCSSFFLLLFSWTDESWGFDSRTPSADQERQQMFISRREPQKYRNAAVEKKVII